MTPSAWHLSLISIAPNLGGPLWPTPIVKEVSVPQFNSLLGYISLCWRFTTLLGNLRKIVSTVKFGTTWLFWLMKTREGLVLPLDVNGDSEVALGWDVNGDMAFMSLALLRGPIVAASLLDICPHSTPTIRFVPINQVLYILYYY